MKIHALPNTFIASLLIAHCLPQISSAQTTNTNGQVFTLAVPSVDPNIINSDSSTLGMTVGDVAGNTLYSINHRKTVMIGSIPDLQDVGKQWVLVSGKGQIVGTREFRQGSGIPTKIVFFSARRILAQVDSGNGVFVEAFRPVNGRLESEGLAVQLPLDSSIGNVTRETQQRPPQKFFDIAVITDGKVTSIRRFDATKIQTSN